MKISHLGLSAFYQVALSLNMSQAARLLGVTQSALSQRVATLEDDLETTLFIREGKALKLTDSGYELFVYCQQHKALEDDFLSRFKSDNEPLSGVIRIASYSSVMRSLILPKLAPFLRQYPGLRVELSTYQTHELFSVLKSNKADLIINDTELGVTGLEEIILAQEEYVLIESNKFESRNHIFLDHESNDRMTEQFLQQQKQTLLPYERCYLGEVYSILDGVELGLGRAVMSKHLIDQRKVRIAKEYKSVFRPIILQYFQRPFYPKIIQEVIAELNRISL